MEQKVPQESLHTTNWFGRHKTLTCFSAIILLFLSLSLFGRISNQTAVKGASTFIPTLTLTVTPTPPPSNTPTLTATPTSTKALVPIRSTIQSNQPTATQEPGLSNNSYYINSAGNEVHSPAYSTDNSVPVGATAQCADGTYSFSQSRRGTCSHHGGVAQWL